jgi:hypothetical protein
LINDSLNPYAAPQVETMIAPGEEWLRSASGSLRQTALGLSLIYWGIILILLGVIGMIPISYLAAWAQGPPGGNLEIAFSLMALPGACILIGALLNFIGPIVCLAVPTETGAKGLIVSSVVFQLFNVANSIANFFLPSDFLPPGVSECLVLLGIVSFALFVLFLNKIGKFIGRLDLVLRANNVLYVMILLIALGVMAFLGGIFLHPLFNLLMLAVGIGGLIVFVTYVNLIDALRKTLKWNYQVP